MKILFTISLMIFGVSAYGWETRSQIGNTTYTSGSDKNTTTTTIGSTSYETGTVTVPRDTSRGSSYGSPTTTKSYSKTCTKIGSTTYCN